MAITLAKMTANADKTYEMRLVAGRAGLSGFVRWVHIIESSDVPEFLNGDELVFTTGIGHIGSEWLTNFAKELYQHKAAGLAVNLGPYIASIPRETIEFCEQNSFPLFTLPWKIRLIDVTYDFCHRIITGEENEVSLASAMKNLIFQPEKREEYAPILERKGFHDVEDYVVIVSSVELNDKAPSAEDWRKIRFAARRAVENARSSGCVFVHESRLVIICKSLSKVDDEFAKRLCGAITDSIAKSVELHVGISGVGLGFEGISACYREAITAVRLAKQKNTLVMNYSEIGVYKLLFGVRSSAILADFVESTLGTLFDYDSKTDSDSVKFLKCYLDCNCSVMETAEALKVHRNTVNYKLKAIKELLKCEFTEEEKMNFLLAFRAKEILDARNSVK